MNRDSTKRAVASRTGRSPRLRTGGPEALHASRMRALQVESAALMGLPPAQALERILDARQPAALVHALAPEDLYLLAHEIGLEDTLPLVRLASERQWEFICDMEAWSGERHDLEGAGAAFELLFTADPQRFCRWVREGLTPAFGLFLHGTLEITLREQDAEPAALAEGFETQDDILYYRLRPGAATGAAAVRLLPRLLERLAEQDHRFFLALLQAADALIPAEAEEEALRLRHVRMAERGFLPLHEAVALYAPLPAASSAGDPRRTGRMPPRSSPPPAQVPLFPLRRQPAGGLFIDLLARVADDPAGQQLAVELAGLCNRIAVADRRAIREKGALDAVVRKACGFIAIGLDEAAPGLPVARALQGHSLEHLFRAGYGRVLAVKRELVRWRPASWFARQGLPLTFWDEHWLGVLGGLLLRRPLHYDPQDLRGSGTLYREFDAPAQVRQAQQVVTEVMALDRLLGCIDFPPLAGRGDARTWKCLLLSAWARESLASAGGGDGPLPLRSFRPFFEALWEETPNGRRVSEARKGAMLAWLSGRCRLPATEVSRLGAAPLEALFEELHQEYAAVPGGALDPRFIRHFWLTR